MGRGGLVSATAFVVASGVKLNQGEKPISVLKALGEFFNVGDGKRGLRASEGTNAHGETITIPGWGDEVRALDASEKHALCVGIADVTGWKITGVNA